jgi:transposase
MGGSYSAALRERAIKFVEIENGSAKEACAVLGIHSSTLTKWLKKYRETGEMKALPRGNYRKRKVDIKLLEQNIIDYPDATLVELAKPFGVFPSTIFYHLKKLDITRKKNAALRRTK